MTDTQQGVALILKDIGFSHKAGDDFSIQKVNLEIPTGIIFGLLGPNGAGKTTLIQIICGLLSGYSGSVSFWDDHKDSAIEVKKQLGMVPQYNGLFNELTLMENLLYFGRLHLIPENILKVRINELAEIMALDHHLNKQIRNYSGGMNRRANIICGLIHDPKFIILDEPTAGVDIHSRHIIHQLIREMKSKGKTIIYTSHLLDEAEQLCDLFCLMDNGSILTLWNMEQFKNAGIYSSIQEMIINLTGEEARD